MFEPTPRNSSSWKTAVVAAHACCAAIIGFVGWSAYAAGDTPRFPDGFESGVRYAVVNRGGIQEEIYTSREAIAAVKAGRPIPSGTVVTMVDTRGGALFRYVVMEKRAGWGFEFPAETRTGDWKFQWFNPDRTVRAGEDLARCMGCHKPQAPNDFLFTLPQMKAATP